MIRVENIFILQKSIKIRYAQTVLFVFSASLMQVGITLFCVLTNYVSKRREFDQYDAFVGEQI